ncbi:conserved membrane hypothetical protein [Crenothrix polyspora]|uniref:DUF423 domain-containing protein n=1 Tax=Crenothrix polyspora TaxID=360316 RepID=A0A1R4H6K5_9GAMM|nr:DUF423 domain-containing protein [Crenothrix polyspora]SJM91490.1 conserved membrane hypothetical protein [Crenothrix polyspora]
MKSGFLFLGAICAFIGVGMGAFGAHALKKILSPEMMAVYQTAVTYQMWHALGLIAIAQLRVQASDSGLLTFAGVLMFLGILLFSGSLYGLALLNLNWLGMITPVGGVCFLTAWLLIALFTIKKQSPSRYNNNARR